MSGSSSVTPPYGAPLPQPVMMQRSVSLPSRVIHQPLLLALEVVLLFTLLAFAFSLRISDLEGARSNFPDLFDEGIRAEQLLLMRHGFRPFRDIYASQGPLLLDVLYPLYVAFGGTLGAARLAVGLISLVGIAGCYWTARVIAGPVAALLAAILLVANPLYLEASRLALAEVPSIAPVIVALGAATMYQRSGRRVWLILAAVLLTVGVLIKPMIVGAVIPVTAAVVLRKGISWMDLAIFAGTGVGLTTLIVLALGPADVYQQIVAYRLGSRANDTWDAIQNYDEVVISPSRAWPALTAFGWLGAVAALARGRRGLPVMLFLVSTYAVLLLYTSLHPKHLVYLVPPLVLAGGVGAGALLGIAVRGPLRLAAVAGAVVLISLAGHDLAGAPAALARGTTLVDDDVDPDLHVYDREVAATLEALVRPDQFILSDHPYLPYLAGRMVPPEMVDPSKGRFRAGVLTSEMAIESAQRRNVDTVLFWSDRFRRLSAFSQWVEARYRAVHIMGPRVLKGRDGKDRSIYVRNDADLVGLRGAAESGLPITLSATFGRDLMLTGARVSTDLVRPGAGFAVTVLWEAVQTVTTDYNMVIAMESDDGQVWAAQQLDLDGVDRGAPWQTGDWLLRSAMLTPEAGTSPGVYRLTVALIHPRTGPEGVTLEPSSVAPSATLAGTRLIIGDVRVETSRT
ncbi:MAG: ArnT family glycosyltransferase [Chloroflexota bacterium]